MRPRRRCHGCCNACCCLWRQVYPTSRLSHDLAAFLRRRTQVLLLCTPNGDDHDMISSLELTCLDDDTVQASAKLTVHSQAVVAVASLREAAQGLRGPSPFGDSYWVAVDWNTRPTALRGWPILEEGVTLEAQAWLAALPPVKSALAERFAARHGDLEHFKCYCVHEDGSWAGQHGGFITSASGGGGGGGGGGVNNFSILKSQLERADFFSRKAVRARPESTYTATTEHPPLDVRPCMHAENTRSTQTIDRACTHSVAGLCPGLAPHTASLPRRFNATPLHCHVASLPRPLHCDAAGLGRRPRGLLRFPPQDAPADPQLGGHHRHRCCRRDTNGHWKAHLPRRVSIAIMHAGSAWG